MSPGARRARLIVNPEARGDTDVAADVLDLVGSAPGWEAGLTATDMRGHGVLLAEEAAADGADLVVSIGGDGTAREVAAGLAGTPTALAIVPAGTGNSSYRALFGDVPWRDVVDAALGANPAPGRDVDLLRVEPTGELSLLGVSAGLFAQIVELAAKDPGPAGPEKYATAAATAAADPVRITARVELDGDVLADGELALVAMGGSPVRGSVFPVLPRSVMDDGLLDVIAVMAADPQEFNEMLGLALTGAHLEHPLVRYGQGRTVTIRAGMQLPMEVDGDIWERHLGETTISVEPGVLKVVAAP